jgi:hypothetical protein
VVSLEPAPTLLCATKSRTVGSVSDSRANFFVNTHHRMFAAPCA